MQMGVTLNIALIPLECISLRPYHSSSNSIHCKRLLLFSNFSKIAERRSCILISLLKCCSMTTCASFFYGISYLSSQNHLHLQKLSISGRQQGRYNMFSFSKKQDVLYYNMEKLKIFGFSDFSRRRIFSVRTTVCTAGHNTTQPNQPVTDTRTYP